MIAPEQWAFDPVRFMGSARLRALLALRGEASILGRKVDYYQSPEVRSLLGAPTAEPSWTAAE